MKAMEEYERFLKEHLINGQFVFGEETNDDINPEMLHIVQQCRLNGYDAVLTMKQIALWIFKVCYNENNQPENELEEIVVGTISKLVNKNDCKKLLSLAIAARNFGFSDLLDYEMDEQEEANVIWRY